MSMTSGSFSNVLTEQTDFSSSLDDTATATATAISCVGAPSTMTVDEARKALTAIAEAAQTAQTRVAEAGRSLRELRALILDFYRRRGYLALGYTSFAQFAESELRGSLKLAYQLKDCAEVELALISAGVDLDPDTPARWLRTLIPLKSDRASLVSAYYHALTLAENARQPLSKRHFELAVQSLQFQRRLRDSHPDAGSVVRLMSEGKLAPQSAERILDEIDKLAPPHRALVVSLIDQHGISDPDLIAPLADVLAKADSRTKDEILATRTIRGVPIESATARDLEGALADSARLYIEEREQAALAKNGVVPIVVTIYKGDAQKTRRALERELGAALFAAYLDEWLSEQQVSTR